MLNVLNQNTNNLKFNNSFLTSLLFGGELEYNNSKTSYQKDNTDVQTDLDSIKTGELELIYANDGDANYDASIDTNGDSKISYKEYLRYCEQNFRLEERRSDTRVSEDKRKFMTYSFGHASNAYNRVELSTPKGKVLSNA
jgi:hypothetical protein